MSRSDSKPDPLRDPNAPAPTGLSKDWPDLSGRIEDDGVHRLAVRVYYEDTDFSGVVYHASYLRFMERGRSDFMRWTGIDHNDLMDAEGGLAFAVRRMIIEFAGSAGIDDVLTIETWMGDMRGASMLVKQRVLLEGRPIITADVKVALVTRAGKPRRMPLWLRKIFAPHAPEGADVDGPE